MSLIIEHVRSAAPALPESVYMLRMVVPTAFAVVALEDPALYGNAKDWERRFNTHRKVLSSTAHHHCNLLGLLRSAPSEISGGCNYHGVLNAARVAKRLHLGVKALSDSLVKINHVPGALDYFAHFHAFTKTFSAWDSLIAWATNPYSEFAYQERLDKLKRQYPDHKVWDPIHVHLRELKEAYTKQGT